MQGLVRQAESETIDSACRMAKPERAPVVEVFCALFSFTAVDNLVHDIEEATLANPGQDPKPRHLPLRQNIGLRNRALRVPD